MSRLWCSQGLDCFKHPFDLIATRENESELKKQMPVAQNNTGTSRTQ
jgi:hypothetical protein